MGGPGAREGLGSACIKVSLPLCSESGSSEWIFCSFILDTPASELCSVIFLYFLCTKSLFYFCFFTILESSECLSAQPRVFPPSSLSPQNVISICFSFHSSALPPSWLIITPGSFSILSFYCPLERPPPTKPSVGFYLGRQAFFPEDALNCLSHCVWLRPSNFQ